MKIVYKILTWIGLVLTCSSCLPLTLNDNNELYGTEWSDEKEEEGLKFFKNNTVLFFSPYTNSSSTFEYNKSTGEIQFGDFMVKFPSFSGEITSAVVENATLYMIWHQIGQTQECYATYYRRR